MSTSTIEIGTRGDERCTLDVETLLGSRMLVQANSGGGKSWMLRRLAEQIAPKVPIIILDLEGEFATLRERHDLLLVGHGKEVPAQVEIAGALAIRLLEHHVSAVIDLYDLPPQQRRAYVRRFLESLMAAPKRLWSPLVVFVDEAHVLAPENGESESTDAVCSLMAQGRKRDFCGILATQRLSKLHKDAAAEANNVLVGRTTLDVDLRRASDVLGFGKADWPRLRDLEAGAFFGYGPAFNHRGVEQITSGGVATTHGRKARDARLPAPSTAMKGTIGELADLAAKAKIEIHDIDAAKARIRELEGKVRAAEKARPTMDPDALARTVAEAKREARAGVAGLVRPIASATRVIADKVITIRAELDALTTLLDSRPVDQTAPVKSRPSLPSAVPTVKICEGDWTGPQREALSAFAWFKEIGIDEPTKEQVCFKCGWRPTSGHIKNVLGSLRSAGMVQGMRLVGEYPAPEIGSLADYHNQIRRTLTGPQVLVFDLLLAHNEQDLDKNAVCERLGWSTDSGHIKNVMGALRSLGVVEKKSYRLSSMVFPEGVA